jgi:hypothetical protein
MFDLPNSSDNLSAMKQCEIFYPTWEKSIWTMKPLSTILFHESKCFRTVIFSNRIFILNMIWVVFFERNLNLVLTKQLIPFQLTIYFPSIRFFIGQLFSAKRREWFYFSFPTLPPFPFLILKFIDFSLPFLSFILRHRQLKIADLNTWSPKKSL